MHVKLAYAVSVAAPVAIPAGRSKKSDDGAAREAAAFAAPPPSGVRVAGAGRAATSGRCIAPLGKDKENGARLAIEEINTHGPTIGRHSARRAPIAGDGGFGPATGAQAAEPRADTYRATAAGRSDRRAPDGGGAGNVPGSAAPFHFDSTKQLAATGRVAAGMLIRATDSDAVLTNVGRGLHDALAGAARAATDGPPARQATASGVGAQTLGGHGVYAGKVVEPAGDAVRNLICPGTKRASFRTEKGRNAGKPGIGRCSMLSYDFKEANDTVLDVVTI
ncbi:branched-chain amino acid ABC transporter [Burkholderia stagnalis]